MTVHELVSMQRDLLFVVYGMDDPCGKAIKRKLERTQDRSILSGQVYSNLDALVEKDLVEKGSKNGRTNEYSLTPKGRSRVHGRVRWERSVVRH